MELLPTDHYFEDVLPNYSSECTVLGFALTLTLLFWVIAFPYLANKAFFGSASDEKNGAYDKEATASIKKESDGSTKQRKGKGSKKSPLGAGEKEPRHSVTFQEETVSLSVLALSSIGCMVSLFWMTMTLSPYNTFVARGVFEVPLLTAQECEKLLNISYNVAERNAEEARKAKETVEMSGRAVNKTVQGLLWEPVGWQKHRHGAYPTTDLNSKCFTKECGLNMYIARTDSN